MSGKRATLKQTVAIVADLEKTLTAHGPNTVFYQDGWSDQRIAEKYDLHAAHVGRIRRELHGEIVRNPSAHRSLEEKMNDLTEEVKLLRGMVSRLVAFFVADGRLSVNDAREFAGHALLQSLDGNDRLTPSTD